MDILFIHPNFPGQFRRISQAAAALPDVKVWGIGADNWIGPQAHAPGIQLLRYPMPPTCEEAHPWARGFDLAVRRGEQVMHTLGQYKRAGLEPDVIVMHPGWGDGFFVRDFFPGAHVVGFFEYYYRAHGADLGFDKEFPNKIDDIFRLHASNATQLLSLESCDVGICPTQWQRSRFPSGYQSHLQVQHEGIDTRTVCPNPNATFRLPDGRELNRQHEVLTFVARNLEPYRGFHTFMRALPDILRHRPHCQVLIVGADGCSYGKPPTDAANWKERMLRELSQRSAAGPDAIDLSRVHFTGALPYAQYLQALQVSRAHVYLTYPFILSWSMLEAMSSGCVVLASNTAPVSEFITDGSNGQLFDFHQPDQLAAQAIHALAHPQAHAHLGQAARQSAVQKLDFETIAWPAYRTILGLD